MKAQSKPIFTIIIPTKDRTALLRRALLSMIRQSFNQFEVLVVDDHSLESPSKMIEELEDERILLLANAGIERSAARNTGISKANGKFICFIDDDDEVSPEYLSDFYDAILKNEKGKYIYRTGYLKCFGDGRQAKGPIYIESKYQNEFRFVLTEFCGCWSLCFPAEIKDECNFDPRFPHWQDTHFIIKVLLAGYGMKQLPGYNYHYHYHDQMGSKNIFNSSIVTERLRLNLAAFEDIEMNHPEVTKFAKDPLIFSRLKAEKCLEYSNSNLYYSDGKKAWGILWKSLKYGIFLRMFKNYLRFIYYALRNLRR